jgi:hypothetical protein
MTRAHRPTHPAAAAALVWILLGLAACDEQERIINGPTPIPPQLVSVTLASDTIVAGTTVQGTVSLSAAAPSGGASVSLSSGNAGVATVPAGVVVPDGTRSASFPVTGIAAGGPITITASLGGTRSANLTVTAAVIQLVSLTSPSELRGVAGPGATQGTVRISNPAPSGGTSVTLTSTNPRIASVPDSVTVQPGATTAAFSIETFAVPNTSQVTVTASFGDRSVSVYFWVTGGIPAMANFDVIPDRGTLATGLQQCEVQAASGNLLKCTFDASLSTATGGISNYIWRFPQSAGIATYATPSRTLSGVTLTCGSFGTGDVGSTVDIDVELEIVFPSGTLKTLKTIRFIRNGVCG